MGIGSRLRNRYLGHPLRVAIASAKTVGIAHISWVYFYSIAWGDGPSMLPTFQVAGDPFLVSRHYRRGRDVQVGDCVVYKIPAKPGQEGVKRVMGMPGDYVLLNSPGAKNDNMIQVPKGHCYIVGDNLPWSRDSRDFGPLPLALIRGKVVARAEFNSWNPFKWWTKLPDILQPPENST